MPSALRYGILVALICSPFLLHAQVNDAGLWMNAEVEKIITPALSASVTGEVRMNENITEVGTVLTDVGLSYRPWKRFDVGLTYRYSGKRRLDDSYDQRHGWFADATYRVKVKPAVIDLRLRFQSRYTDILTSDDGNIPRNHLRGRVKLKLDLDRRYEPYVSGEAFYRVGGADGMLFDELRCMAGVEVEFNQAHAIDLHYMVTREYQVNNPRTDYVVGIGYHFIF